MEENFRKGQKRLQHANLQRRDLGPTADEQLRLGNFRSGPSGGCGYRREMDPKRTNALRDRMACNG
jgi:hypothetical protein